MNDVPRCVNIDWLEVAVLEPNDVPHDPDYFRACGYVVNERDYGTRVWREMFTLEGSDGLPFMEVRRCPKSTIIQPNVSHLRFVNRICYFPNAADIMADFINRYHYEFIRISRVDVCLDFEYFDYGDLPRDFMRRLMCEKYAKINQANIHAHGSDEWSGRVWNSLSWGSPSSDIGTKFYNKTLELYDPITKRYGKPYIRQAWQAAGLITDAVQVTKTRPDGTTYTPEIWRVEFSIRSNVSNWFLISLNGKAKQKQSIRNTLDMYDTPEKLLIMFASLQQHYFRFKHVLKRYNFYKEGHTEGYAIRKDKCPDKLLFRWKGIQSVYKVEKKDVATSEKPNTELMRLLSHLKAFRQTTHDESIRKSCDILIEYLTQRYHHFDQTNPLNRHEVNAMQLAVRAHIKRPTIDPAVLLKLAREEMRLRDGIDPFF